MRYNPRTNVECIHVIPSMITTPKDACIYSNVCINPSPPPRIGTGPQCQLQNPLPEPALPLDQIASFLHPGSVNHNPARSRLPAFGPSLNPSDLAKPRSSLPAFDAEAPQLLSLLNDPLVQKQPPPSKAPAARENPFSCPKLVPTCPN